MPGTLSKVRSGYQPPFCPGLQIVLLLAGLLHAQRIERVDVMVSSALDAINGTGFGSKLKEWLGAEPSLADQACQVI
jgi:hypothetical protein